MEFGIRVDNQQLTQSSAAPRAQLAAWRVGQVLSALVIEGTPAQAGGGPARLQVGNLQIPVRSQTPLQTGESLRLNVQRAGKEIILTRAPTTSAPVTAPTTTVAQTLRNLLPAQQALDVALRGLSKLLPQLPTTAAAPARELLGSLPTPAQLTTGSGLKQAILSSGTLLESRLAAGTPPAPQDIKAAAARLLLALPVQGSAAGAPRQLAEGLMGRIGLNQLQSQSPSGNTVYWSLELPVRTHADGFHTVQLEVQTEEKGSTDAESGPNWNVRLHLDLPRTGPLDAYVTSRHNTLSAHFWSTDAATAARIAKALPDLARAWSAHGLATGVLQSHRGEAPRSGHGKSPLNGLVDTRA